MCLTVNNDGRQNAGARRRIELPAGGVSIYDMQSIVIVEPESTFIERHVYAAEDAFAFKQADPHVINLLRSGPVHIMKVVNVVG